MYLLQRMMTETIFPSMLLLSLIMMYLMQRMMAETIFPSIPRLLLMYLLHRLMTETIFPSMLLLSLIMMYLMQRMMTETIFPSIPRLPVRAVDTPRNQKWRSCKYIVDKIYCCPGNIFYWRITVVLGIYCSIKNSLKLWGITCKWGKLMLAMKIY